MCSAESLAASATVARFGPHHPNELCGGSGIVSLQTAQELPSTAGSGWVAGAELCDTLSFGVVLSSGLLVSWSLQEANKSEHAEMIIIKILFLLFFLINILLFSFLLI
jgi:hypothetical protein